MKAKLTGSGLGLRREMLPELVAGVPKEIDYFEIAPENWLALGGKFQEQLSELTSEHPFVCHGLSLSLGSPDPLDENFVRQVGDFLLEHNILVYSEHLSYCSYNGHMYDLMPIPFRLDAVKHVSDRIKRVQDILGRSIAVENVSYYASLANDIPEIEFTNLVLETADCQLLLDVNNIYVNSINHGYDANEFLKALPTKRIAYGHIAGHYDEAIDLKIDTHGADVIQPVWQLLAEAYRHHGVFPTLLERDFNIPAVSCLVNELEQIKQLQSVHTSLELRA